MFARVSPLMTLMGIGLLSLAQLPARAGLPAPTEEYVDWTLPWNDIAPGVMAADSLLHKPAGKFGHVTVKGDHFYVGDQRIRFWGVNLCGSACFPTHEGAEQLAQRLARFGINSVRLHHMDAKPAPDGLFADLNWDTFSPEQLDRLDYLIAALKRNGIYTNINLHVSRPTANVIYPGADKYNRQNKFINLFDPKLIEADKKFFRELLTHVNPYTQMSYTDDPAICVVEINNENNCFSWTSWGLMADKRPEPFMSQLNDMWHAWLAKKYDSREKLEQAWAAKPETSPNVLKDPGFADVENAWEPIEGEKATLTKITVDGTNGVEISGTGLRQRNVQMNRWAPFTVSFRARAEKPVDLAVHAGIGENITSGTGLHTKAQLTSELQQFHFSFVPPADSKEYVVSLMPAGAGNSVEVTDLVIQEGGREGLAANEDIAAKNIAFGVPRGPFTRARYADFYDFLHSIDQGYYTEMHRFLKEDLKVKSPVCGSYACSPLGTLSQTNMDYVDAHGYWDSPRFKGAAWGSTWSLHNTPMVDETSHSEIFKVACHRIEGKPFTLSEYNHGHPNDWQAECMPILATYAAMQDWDAVWVFAYTHDRWYQKNKITSFFNIEGNPVKLNLMPMASRIFLNQKIKPLAGEKVIHLDKQEILDNILTYWHDLEPYVKDRREAVSHDTVTGRLSVTFDKTMVPEKQVGPIEDPRFSWTSAGKASGTGQYILRDPYASVFTGFARGDAPIDVGYLKIEKLESPFASFMLTAADAEQPLASADRLLLVAAARQRNSNMIWDAERTSTAEKPGDAPPQIEIVKAKLSVEGVGPLKVFALKPDGSRGNELPCAESAGRRTFEIGAENTMWYELVR